MKLDNKVQNSGSEQIQPMGCPCSGSCGFTCAKKCTGCSGNCTGYCVMQAFVYPGEFGEKSTGNNI